MISLAKGTQPLERRRDRRRRDVLALRGLEHVLLTVGDPQEALGVEFTDVTGVEPAVGVDRLGSGIRQVVIPAHHTGTLEQHLAVLGDLDLGLGERPSHGAESVGVRAVQRRGRRRFGQTVAFEHDDAHGVEPLGDVAVQRGRARDEEAQPAAEPLADRRQHQPVGELVLHGQQW